MKKVMFLSLLFSSLSFAADFKVGDYTKSAYFPGCFFEVVKVSKYGKLDLKSIKKGSVIVGKDPSGYTKCKPTKEELSPDVADKKQKERVNMGL